MRGLVKIEIMSFDEIFGKRTIKRTCHALWVPPPASGAPAPMPEQKLPDGPPSSSAPAIWLPSELSSTPASAALCCGKQDIHPAAASGRAATMACLCARPPRLADKCGRDGKCRGSPTAREERPDLLAFDEGSEHS